MPPETKTDVKEKTGEINILKIGETDSNLPSPIDLNFRITKEIEFSSLKWTNADEIPRLMKISNSGHSVIVTAKWLGPHRPYITGGQLPGEYIFSQAHFHWGRHDKEGSEHTIEGVSQPLELHVMYFKTDYKTPENAMKELDGIVVFAYIYNLRKKANTELAPVIEALPKVVQPYTSSPIQLTPISKLAPIFTDDYFLYWGSVLAQTNYKIVWIVHRQAQTISAEQLALFRSLMGANKEPLVKNFRDTKSVNGRTILFVNPGTVRDRTIIEAEPDPVEKPPTPPDQKGARVKTKKPSTQRGESSKRKSSAKRKSSVRRQSKKSTQKLQKSEYHDACDRDVLSATLVDTDSLESDHSKRSSESCSDISLTSSSRSPASGGGSLSAGSSCYDVKEIQKRCELIANSQDVESSPISGVSDILAGSDVSTRCDELLHRLQATSAAKRDTCLEILDNLERMVRKSVEMKATPSGTTQKITEIKSMSEDSEQHVIQIDETTSKIPLLEIKECRIITLNCPKMQFAMIHSVPAPNQQQIIKLFIGEETIPTQETRLTKFTPKTRELSQGPTSALRPRIPMSLADRIRRDSRKRTDPSTGESSESEVGKKNIFDELMNNTMLTAVWKQVTSPSGMIMNETMTVVTSQTSNDDKTDRQNVSYLQQNTFLEIEPKSGKGRFQGQKVEKVKRKMSGRAFPIISGPLGREKRQTMVMKMFVNEVATTRKIKPPVRPKYQTDLKPKTPFEQERKVTIRQRSPSKKPWKY